MNSPQYHQARNLSLPDLLTKVKQKKEANLFTDNYNFPNDFDHLTYEQNSDEDKEDVKRLDVWNLPHTTRSLHFDPSLHSPKNAKEFQQKKIRGDSSLPSIKTDLLNRILTDREDEIVSAPVQASDRNDDSETTRLPLIRKDGDKFKRYEATKIEHNEELIHELVVKKMREQINVDMIAKMGQTQLKLYIKAIAEEAVAHFKSLKGLLTPQLIQNYVYAALEMVRESKNGINATAPKMSKDLTNWSKDDRPVMNYDMTELLLVKEFEANVKQAKELRLHLTDLGHQIFKAKKERALYEDKLRQIKKEVDELTKGIDIAENLGRYTHRRTAISSPSMVKDHMMIKKIKDEKKQEEAQVNKTLQEIAETQATLDFELSQATSSLKVVKSAKANCRVQLKKLYYKILKDEDSLIRSTENNKSYTWILRALWNLGEDVKNDAFPLFLDAKAREFFIEYAKAHDELEIHCRQNNLSNLLNNLKGFKPLNNVVHHRSERKESVIKPFVESPAIESPGSFPDLENISHSRAMAKSLNVLIYEYQEKASELKKINLKAKRLVPAKPYNGGDKNSPGLSKWEEVDPQEIAALNFGDASAGLKRNIFEERKPSIIRSSTLKGPIEKAMDILDNLDMMKKDAVEKLTKIYTLKILDERTKLDLNKTFRFLFGREEGDQFFFKLISEKKYAEEKLGVSLRKVKPKAGVDISSQSLAISISPLDPKNLSSLAKKGVEIPSSTRIKPTIHF